MMKSIQYKANSQQGPSCPAISICMPVYNGEVHLRRSLDSLLAQSFENFELVISDNASTDGTEIICAQYAQRDKRIRYVRRPKNFGAAANYNHLMDLIRTEYFFFAPHDDEWLPSWIEAAVKALDEDNEASIALGSIDFVDRERRLVATASPPWQLDQGNPVDRIAHYLDTEVTDHILYGVVRRNSVEDFRLGLGETSPERALIFHILVAGKVIDVPAMKMINHLSFKTQDELYEFFKFKLWYLANIKTHISVIGVFFKELPFQTATLLSFMYFREIFLRKFFRRKKRQGNVHIFNN